MYIKICTVSPQCHSLSLQAHFEDIAKKSVLLSAILLG